MSPGSPLVPCEGGSRLSQPPQGSTECPTAPHSQGGVTAGLQEDVCLSSQVQAGCALQINSSFYTYSFCLCTQPACQRPGGAFSPVLPLVWVLQMFFIQSGREEEGTWQIYEVCGSFLASWDTLTFTH